MSDLHTLNLTLGNTLHLSTATSRPPVGETTGEQAQKSGSTSLGNIFATAGGAAGEGFKGFGPPPAGTFKTYRQIEKNPTVALGLGKIVAQLAANEWGWQKKNDDVPDEYLETLRDWFTPLREQLVIDGMLALRRGFAPFEQVWERDDDGHYLPYLKPLLPDFTEFLIEKPKAGDRTIVTQVRRGIAGLRNKPDGGDAVDLGPLKSFAYTFGGEAGDPYGCPLLENLRIIWPEAETIRKKIGKYVDKQSGVIGQIHYPDGTSKDSAGADRANFLLASQMAQAASEGKWLLFNNAFASFVTDPQGMTPAVLEKALQAAGKSQWVVSFVDPGGTDHTPGFVNLLEYYDKLLVRGLVQPERTLLEGQHGTKAEAGEHGEVGTYFAGLVDRSFARAFNRGVLDDCLELNWGRKARGSIYVMPAPLADHERETKEQVLLKILSNQSTAEPMTEKIDEEALGDDLGIPIKSDMRGQPLVPKLPTFAKPRVPAAQPDNDTSTSLLRVDPKK